MAKSAKHVPLGRRISRSTRRGFYKVAHAITPAALRRSIRGGPEAQEARKAKRRQRKLNEHEAKRKAKLEATQAKKDAAQMKAELKTQGQARKAEKEERRGGGTTSQPPDSNA